MYKYGWIIPLIVIVVDCFNLINDNAGLFTFLSLIVSLGWFFIHIATILDREGFNPSLYRD